MKKYILCFLLTIGSALAMHAQFADSLRAQLLKDWNRSKRYTLDYLRVMPADKYGFRPQDSVRSFAQQMIHLAQANVSLMEAATGAPIPAIINRPDLEQSISAASKDSVIYFVTLSYDYAVNAWGGLDLNKCFEHVKRGKFDETRLAWALKAYEHQAHHRGQTTIYLRTAGVKPPNELLFDNMYQ